MTKGIESLALEVHKIVNAPYLVSLKRLHSLLEDEGESVLEQWARIHSSEISILASTVVQGLSQWPYVFEIVGQLSSVSCLRDALLDASPTLLSQLLDKAVESDSSFERYSSICLKLLQEPLDPKIALPHSAQAILWKFFEKAVNNPNAATMEPVYFLLDGACRDILGILPKQGLERLHEHLTKIMRKVKGIEGQLVNLFCLAIISKTIPQSSQSNLNSRKSQRSESRPETVAPEAANFFTGDRASKTIHLLALQVIYACRHENDASEDQKLKPLRLAREILAAIGSNHREKWAEDNPSISRKLQEKVKHEDLPKTVHFEAMAFMSMLFPDADCLEKSIFSAYQKSLLSLYTVVTFERHLDSALSISLPFFAPHLDQLFWADFFRTYLERLRQTKQDTTHSEAFLLKLLLTLEMTCLECSVTRKNVIEAVSSNGISEMLESTTAQKTTDRNLAHNVFASLLRIGTAPMKDDLTLKTSIVLTLVTKLQEYAQMYTCQGSANKNSAQVAHLPLIEQASTPDEHGASHHWRERLTLELGSEAKYRHESIVRFVSQVCRDLEQRCEHVEEPLRAKQAESDGMKIERDKSQARVKRLETELVIFQAKFAALEASVSRFEAEQTDTQLELTSMSQKCRSLEEQLKKTKVDADHENLNMRRDFESQKLNLQAIIACHVEKLDESTTKIDALKLHTIAAEAQARQEREQAQGLQTSLEDANSGLSRSLEAERVAILDKERSLDNYNECRAVLETKISRLENDIQKISTETEQASQARQIAEQEYNNLIENLRTEHEINVRNLQSEMTLQQQILEERLEETIFEMTQINEQYQVQIRNRKQEYLELQQKMRSCQEDCREKSSQLREAQGMKLRLLSAMGMHEEDSVSHQTEQKDPAGIKQMKDGAKKQKFDRREPETHEIEPRAESTRSESDSAKASGSSPKRAKPRTTFQMPRNESGRSTRSSQMEFHSRDRCSLQVDLRGLEETSTNTANIKDGSRRRSENPKLFTRFINIESSSQSEGDRLAEHQTSEGAAPGDQENKGDNTKLLSTSDNYFEGLGTEDFEGSTVEL